MVVDMLCINVVFYSCFSLMAFLIVDLRCDIWSYKENVHTVILSIYSYFLPNPYIIVFLSNLRFSIFDSVQNFI